MIPLLIAGGAAAAGGIASYFANMSAQERAAAMQDKDMQEWLAIQIPNPAEQKLAMQKLVSQGTLTPQLEQAFKQDPSAFKAIQTSQAHKGAQNRALMELEKMGSEGGLRLQDKAALQEAQMQAQIADRGNRLGIQDEMARRGQGGSGFDLQAQLQGQQATGDRAARSSLSVAAQAQDRALQSIMGAGDMATKFRGQDFNEQSARAQAEDAINRFNTGNMQDVQSRNVGMQNRAQEQNLNNNQRIADQNVGISNDEQRYNKGLIQQNYENQVNKQKAISNVRAGQAQTEINKGQIQGNLYSNLGGAVSGAASAAGAQQSQNDYWDNYFKKQKGQA